MIQNQIRLKIIKKIFINLIMNSFDCVCSEFWREKMIDHLKKELENSNNTIEKQKKEILELKNKMKKITHLITNSEETKDYDCLEELS